MSDLIEGLVENTFLIIIPDQERRVQTIPVDNVRLSSTQAYAA